MNNIDSVVLYHKNCNDGYVAALVMYAYFSEMNLLHVTNFIPVQYSEPLPDEELLKGKTVYILDFSFSREDTARLADLAGTLFMLDHHEAAVNNLFTGDKFLDKALVETDEDAGVYVLHTKTVSLMIDKTESGATLAYDTFGETIDNEEIKTRLKHLCDHAKDRDLWNFTLPNTLAIHEYCSSLNFDLKTGYELLVQSSPVELNNQIEKAQVRVDMRNELANKYASKAVNIQFMGYEIPAVNVPSDFSSIVGDILDKDAPFALMYAVGVDKVFCSLRSNKVDGINVNQIANKFGGGGHFHAAGFSIPTNKLDDMLSGEMDNEDYFLLDSVNPPTYTVTEYETRPFTNLIIWLIIAMVTLNFLYVNINQSGDVNEHIPNIKQSVLKET